MKTRFMPKNKKLLISIEKRQGRAYCEAKGVDTREMKKFVIVSLLISKI